MSTWGPIIGTVTSNTLVVAGSLAVTGHLE